MFKEPYKDGVVVYVELLVKGSEFDKKIGLAAACRGTI